MNSPHRLTRVTLADRLFQQLRQQILSGRLEVGETLPSEQDIGEAFGVGRTTVRESLRGLVSSGLVERRGRALVVRHPDAIDEITLDFESFSSISAVEQAYDARKLVEGHAVRLAAENRSSDDLRCISGLLTALDTDDAEAYHAADPEFHTAIVKASGNDVLHQLYLSSRHVFFKLPAFWRVFGSTADSRRSRSIGSGYEGHLALFVAIEAGDSEAACRLTDELLEGVKRDLMAAISTRATTEGRSAKSAEPEHVNEANTEVSHRDA